MKKHLNIIFPLLLLFLAVIVIFIKRQVDRHEFPEEQFLVENSNQAFKAWSDFERTSQHSTFASIEKQKKALQLAATRRDAMLELMAKDPEQALKYSISRSQYAALPQELKVFFEQPFSATGVLNVISICNPSANLESLKQLEIDGNIWQAVVVDKRLVHTTKKNTAFAGITLGNRAVISDQIFETVSSEDELAVTSLPLGNPDATRDFLTGAPLRANAITTLAGGSRYLLNPDTDINAVNERLRSLDEKIGPYTGSQILFALAASSDSTTSVDWDALQSQVTFQSTMWTESPKSVFFIRADFSDVTGAPESQADLTALLNGPVANSIYEMSYGKTSINASVSTMTVRLPQPSNYYLSNGELVLHNDATAVYRSLTNANALDGYDIVGIQFPSVGFPFGGAANRAGPMQWIQGKQGLYTFVHEFGHNYGLAHARFWSTNDNSVVGPGNNVDYGDIFDMMGSGLYENNHFHMQAKQSLNWIDSSQWKDTSNSGIERVYRFDSPDTTGSIRALRITKSSSPSQYYWVGFRPGIPENPYLQNGAYLLWQRPDIDGSILLDTSPGSSGGRQDSAIPIGKTYSDTTANIHITPVAIGGSVENRYLDINVQFGPFAGNFPPTATLNAPATAKARELVTLTVSANDPNSDTLAYSWHFGDDTPSINSSTITHNWLIGGSYTITVVVTDMKGGSVTLSQNITITDPLSTWNTRASGTTANLQAVTQGGGKLIAVGDTNGTYRISNDGTTWTGGTISQNIMLYGITYAVNQFVAVGQDYDFSSNPNRWKGAIYTSPNGTTWTRRYFSGNTLRDITYGNGTYIAVGDGATVLTSSNGTSWAAASTGTTTDLRSIDYGNNTFVAVGSAPDGSNVSVVTSTNGISWADHSSGAGVESWKGFNNIRFANDRFLACGWKSRIRHSTDNGQSFTSRETKLLLAPGIAYGNNLYFVAGIEESATEDDINLISIDGENWSLLTTNTEPERRAAIFFNNTFVTVGLNGSIRQTDPFTSPQLDPYISWKNFCFPGNPPLSNETEDYDGDGAFNLEEYATGSDPKNPADRVTMDFKIISEHPVLTIPKNPAAFGVTTRVEYSLDLITWGTAGLIIEQESPYLLVVRLDKLVSSPDSKKAFFRVVFER